MTSRERAAMQQALNWIDANAPRYVFEAIEEALAEQATVSGGLCGGCAKKAADGWALYCVECWEKAEQKPVSPYKPLPEVIWSKPFSSGAISVPVQQVEPPVRTKDLTDDEIDAFIDRAWDKQMSMPEIIRAVIAADREKNK